jgi:N-acetylglucosaminyldiphosphoundecaprenol N-acetyl-beta-D-mannosaminyltransferase
MHVPEKLNRYPVLDCRIVALTFREAVRLILHWAVHEKRRDVHFCTVDTLLKSHDDPRLAAVLNSASLTLPDGIPLVILGRMSGHRVTRVYGPDVMHAVLSLGRTCGLRHYFYGNTQETLTRMTANITEKFPGIEIAGGRASVFRDLTGAEKAALAEEIARLRPHIVWCGLGTPRQDSWVDEFKGLVDVPVMAAVGGAFNVFGGTVAQAPRWMMRSGLEWFFRLCAEPRRLWRRYLVGNPRFLYLLWQYRRGRKPGAGPAAKVG